MFELGVCNFFLTYTWRNAFVIFTMFTEVAVLVLWRSRIHILD
jgi:energy-converting hydrogenase Eha subunit E